MEFVKFSFLCFQSSFNCIEYFYFREVKEKVPSRDQESEESDRSKSQGKEVHDKK